jgi:hypothetical protein
MADRIRFHLDEHVDPAIATALRRAGIDVTTTNEAGLRRLNLVRYRIASGSERMPALNSRMILCGTIFPSGALDPVATAPGSVPVARFTGFGLIFNRFPSRELLGYFRSSAARTPKSTRSLPPGSVTRAFCATLFPQLSLLNTLS